MNKTLSAALAALLLLASCAGTDPALDGRGSADSVQSPTVPLFGTQDPSSTAGFSTWHSTVAFRRASGGASELVVDFQAASWPGFTLRPPQVLDLSDFAGVGLSVENPGAVAVRFSIRFDDDPRADGSNHSHTASAVIPARSSTDLLFPVNDIDPLAHGMVGGPGLPPYELCPEGWGAAIDPSRIVQIIFFIEQPAEPVRLVLGSPLLLRDGAGMWTGLVDEFGQAARAAWPGKLRSADELALRARSEVGASADRAVSEIRAAAGFDPYGGWLGGPALEATGFFRTTQSDGRWWLVTPGGRLFFSIGVDDIVIQNPTYVEGRETMFEALPLSGDPLAAFYGRSDNSGTTPGGRRRFFDRGATYDFYRANLFRKFGGDYAEEWRRTTLDRLASWGFNTVGNWSDASLFGTAGQSDATPFCVSAWIDPSGLPRISSGSDWWGPMYDPFDARFRAAVERAIRYQADRYRDNPWLLGYFVDNELSWGGGADPRVEYGLALGALSLGPGSAAKQALIGVLREAYSSAEEFCRVWGIGQRGWDELLASPIAVPAGAIGAAVERDLATLFTAIADEYFRTVAETIARIDPNHLYLGCRFGGQSQTLAVRAAALYCDVITFNIYRESLDPAEWGFTSGLGKPCLIGEFHFGALDTGFFAPGLVRAADQADRGRRYVEYADSVAALPAFVGFHWFRYADQPLTGRVFDGENYGIGLVDVTDTPYSGLVSAASAWNRNVYDQLTLRFSDTRF